MSRATPPPRPRSIWIVNPADDIPGEELPPQRAWSLARVLAGRGHDVTWWSGTWSGRRKAIRQVPVGVRDDEGFSVRLVAVRPHDRDASLARFASQRDFGKSFERVATESIASGHLERPDIILATLPPLEGAEASMRLARRLDATFVLDLTEAWPEGFETRLPGPRWVRGLVAPFLVPGLLRRRRTLIEAADAIAGVVRPLVDGAIADLAPGGTKPVHVCGIGAYPQAYPPPPRIAAQMPTADGVTAEQAAVDRNALQCICSSSSTTGRDQDLFFAAARHLSASGTPAVFHVACRGMIADSLRRAAEGTRGSCRVQVHGLLDRSAHIRLLTDAHIGIVPGEHETAPDLTGVVGDYAAAGLAIVHALTGEIGRAVESHDAGVSFAAGDASSLARAVASLAADRRRLLDLRHNARRLAEMEFDRERTYAAYAAWLETVAD